METHHINCFRWDNRVVNLQIINRELNVAYARGRPIVAGFIRLTNDATIRTTALLLSDTNVQTFHIITTEDLIK